MRSTAAGCLKICFLQREHLHKAKHLQHHTNQILWGEAFQKKLAPSHPVKPRAHMFTWSLLTLQGDKINWQCYASPCPTGLFFPLWAVLLSQHIMKSSSHTDVSVAVLQREKKTNKNHTNKKTGFVRLCWVKIYAPKLMASFNMKTRPLTGASLWRQH